MGNKVVIKLVLDAQLKDQLKARAAIEMRPLNSSIIFHLQNGMANSGTEAVHDVGIDNPEEGQPNTNYVPLKHNVFAPRE